VQEILELLEAVWTFKQEVVMQTKGTKTGRQQLFWKLKS
jgi:hypothetical protein